MTPADLLKLAAPRRGSIDFDGTAVHFRELTHGEQQRISGASRDELDAVARGIVRNCLITADGAPLFPADSDFDIGTLSSRFVGAVFAAIGQLSQPEVDEKKA